ncbi:MAG TPA: hypothetical protein VF941_07980, partial [Clostridia bacterium]
MGVNEGSRGINVLFVDNSSAFNAPLTSAGELVRLKFQVNTGITDGAYVMSYSDGWSFTSMNGNSTVEIDALFKPGLFTTGVYSVYSNVPFTQLNTGYNMQVEGSLNSDYVATG